MAFSRRDFVRASSVAAAAIGLSHLAPGAASAMPPDDTLPLDDPAFRELTARALEAAKAAGASYADVRISRNRTQNLFTRERRVQGVVDNETFGFGVRVPLFPCEGVSCDCYVREDNFRREMPTEIRCRHRLFLYLLEIALV